MGRIPPGDGRICESAENRRSDQISSSQSFRVFPDRHHLVLQGPAPVGCRDRFYHFRVERVIRSFCDHSISDGRTSASGIHFPDCDRLVYGRPPTDGAGDCRRVSGGSF